MWSIMAQREDGVLQLSLTTRSSAVDSSTILQKFGNRILHYNLRNVDRSNDVYAQYVLTISAKDSILLTCDSSAWIEFEDQRGFKFYASCAEWSENDSAQQIEFKFPLMGVDYVAMIKGDKACLCIELKSFRLVETVNRSLATTMSAFDPKKFMAEGLELIDNATFADVQLQVADGQRVSASKFALAAHSAVFRAMFSHKNTKESETGVVEIAEANADAVRALVRFCYGGCVEKLDEMVVDLFVLSDRYEMESLMKLCANRISELKIQDQTLPMLAAACKHRYVQLCDELLDRAANNMRSLVASAEWPNFERDNEQAASELYKRVALIALKK